jgi:hypothetical protein
VLSEFRGDIAVFERDLASGTLTFRSVSPRAKEFAGLQPGFIRQLVTQMLRLLRARRWNTEDFSLTAAVRGKFALSVAPAGRSVPPFLKSALTSTMHFLTGGVTRQKMSRATESENCAR